MRCLVLVVAAVAVACAPSYWVENRMQMDGTYLIDVKGDGFTDPEGVRQRAEQQATALCQGPFQTKNEIPEKWGVGARTQLIVACNGK